MIYPEIQDLGSPESAYCSSCGVANAERVMAKKRKRKKTFDVVKAVKSASRAAIGAVPATRRVEVSTEKHGKGTKYKPTLGELLADE